MRCSRDYVYFAWGLKGYCFCYLEKYPEAISCHEKALEIRGESIQAFVNIGIAQTKQGFYTENISESEKKLGLEPDEPNLGQQYYQSAISTYEDASRINSFSKTMLIFEGFTYYRAGDYEKAVKNCDKALKINKEDELAWYYRGLSLNQLEYYEDAISSFDKAIKFNYITWEVWAKKGEAIKQLSLNSVNISLSSEQQLSQIQESYKKQRKCLKEGQIYLENLSKKHSEDYAMLDYEIGNSYLFEGQDLYNLAFLV